MEACCTNNQRLGLGTIEGALGRGGANTYTAEQMFLEVELAGRGTGCLDGLENLGSKAVSSLVP